MTEKEKPTNPTEAKYKINQLTLTTLGVTWILDIDEEIPELTMPELVAKVREIRTTMFVKGFENMQIPVAPEAFIILGEDAIKNMVMHIDYDKVVEPNVPS